MISQKGHTRWHGGACVTTERSIGPLDIRRKANGSLYAEQWSRTIESSPTKAARAMKSNEMVGGVTCPQFHHLAMKVQNMGAAQAAQKLQAVTNERRRLGEQVHVRGHFGAKSRVNIIEPFTFSHIVKTPNGQMLAVVSNNACTSAEANAALQGRSARQVRPSRVIDPKRLSSPTPCNPISPLQDHEDDAKSSPSTPRPPRSSQYRASIARLPLRSRSPVCDTNQDFTSCRTRHSAGSHAACTRSDKLKQFAVGTISSAHRSIKLSPIPQQRQVGLRAVSLENAHVSALRSRPKLDSRRILPHSSNTSSDIQASRDFQARRMLFAGGSLPPSARTLPRKRTTHSTISSGDWEASALHNNPSFTRNLIQVCL